MAAGYWGEPLVKYIDSISPTFCRHISLYLRQFVGFTIPPGLWLVLLTLVGLTGFLFFIRLCRVERVRQ